MEMPPELAEMLQGMDREDLEQLMRSMESMGRGSNSRLVGRTTSFQDVTDDIDGRDRVNLDPEELISRYGLPRPSSFPKPAEVRKEASERATDVLVCNISDTIFSCWEETGRAGILEYCPKFARPDKSYS